jgi:uncharacterized membrane protein YfcA
MTGWNVTALAGILSREDKIELMFSVLVLAASILAAGIASVAGFGIGSVLTPVFGLIVPTPVAVAAVSVPHFVATALRLWLLRARVDRRVVLSFGLTSAAGGLTGALLQQVTSSPWLTMLFGGLLLFTAASELTGLSRRMRFEGPAAWVAGAVSGLFGGLVGNQGGIRSAALLGFHVQKDVFVASATAIGLIVDGARMPVYLVTQGRSVTAIWPCVVLAVGGVLAGTWFGSRVLSRLPERTFRRFVAVLIGILGAAMMVKGL